MSTSPNRQKAGSFPNRANKREAGILANFAKQIQTCMYDFSKDGGAAGDYLFGVKLPANAVVTNLYTDEQTALVGSTSVTLKAGATSLSGAIDFTASAGMQSPALAGAAAAIKLSADSELKATVVGTITAGKVRFAVEYYVSK